MNIELLHGTLEISENPGMETIDPRFTDIASLVQDGRYEEAASGAEEILSEKIYDIRIIGYFLYGHFIERGIPAFTDIYLCLADLLNENWNAIGPLKNREKQLQTILNWLTRQILKKLQYEEEKKTAVYDEWMTAVSSDQVQEAMDAGEKLRRILGSVLEDMSGPVLEGIVKINEWLKAFQRLVYREREPEQEQKFESVEEKEPEDIEETRAEQGEPDTLKKRINQTSKAERYLDEEENPGLEGSYHLKLLIRKLEAFDYLISSQKYINASIIADDINSIIAGFDPRIYFPKLFVNFVLKSATSINYLTSCDAYKESPVWHAMQDLYRVDLDSFVDFEPDISTSTSYGGGGDYDSSDYNESRDEDDYM